MAIRRRRPQNASLRYQSFVSSEDITKKKPDSQAYKPVNRTHLKEAQQSGHLVAVRNSGHEVELIASSDHADHKCVEY